MSRSIVDTDRIAAAAGDITRLAESIRGDVAALRARLTALDGSWEGPAKAEFVRVMHDYQGLQAKVNESLADIARLTSRASAAYLEHENATRALFAR
ncbi:type VII secretion protein [Intrasporangium oryzae NRRL B-24470]|uniref:ESAT-6-like protein n=1 Tax=Intrasporangium oryzae NRRL B-24470 TaxID=1386089 RepID=W9GFL6_9MICO|nr:WXG100 family type VII secretion target [Intrasporangium oryzae]EWT02669.1 type VII secretion protein [Intrasporangium oryzae NRRL B-24470]